MERKTFRELYEEERIKPTAAQKFVTEVAELTKRAEMTVRMWLSGKQVPDDLAKSIIASKYGVDVNGLFPTGGETGERDKQIGSN